MKVTHHLHLPFPCVVRMTYEKLFKGIKIFTFPVRMWFVPLCSFHRQVDRLSHSVHFWYGVTDQISVQLEIH